MPKTRVAISYRNGFFALYDPSTKSMAEGVDREEWMRENSIEITEAEWIAYQSFMVIWEMWQQKIANWDKF